MKFHNVSTLALGLAAGVAALAASPATAAPTYNCAKAYKATEQAICRNVHLQKFDRQLNDLYRKMRKHPTAYGYGRDELKTDQLEWMLGRNQCGWDAGCIEEAYLARLEYLQTFTK